MIDLLHKGYEYGLLYGVNIVIAILIFVIGKWVAGLISRVSEQALLRTRAEKTLASFTRSIVYFSILTFVIIAALNKLGVETSSFLAIIGAAGLAVGLALQGSLSNFAAGVMMIIFHPFKIGDYIEACGAEGRVQEIQLFTTIIISKDGKRIIIPNSKITSDKVAIHP